MARNKQLAYAGPLVWLVSASPFRQGMVVQAVVLPACSLTCTMCFLMYYNTSSAFL